MHFEGLDEIIKRPIKELNVLQCTREQVLVTWKTSTLSHATQRETIQAPEERDRACQRAAGPRPSQNFKDSKKMSWHQSASKYVVFHLNYWVL